MAGPLKSFGERIADALVEDGLLTSKQVVELLEQQKKEGVRLLKLVTEKGYVGEMDLAVSMGRVLNVPPVNLGRTYISPDVSDLLPRDVAVNYRVCPVSRLENRLFLAMADPLNVLAVDDVKRLTKLDIVPMIASERAITDKLHQIESAKSGTMEDIIQDAEAKAADEADGLETVKDIVEEVNIDQLSGRAGKSTCSASRSHSGSSSWKTDRPGKARRGRGCRARTAPARAPRWRAARLP